jgi:Putative viral replication protein
MCRPESTGRNNDPVLTTDTPSVSEVSRVVSRYPLGVHASQNLLHDTPWVCTSTGIHDTLRVCINHKLRGLAVKCTCHTPHSAHTRTGYTCTRVKAELYDKNPDILANMALPVVRAHAQLYKMAQSRFWCFTLNNYTCDELEHLDSWCAEEDVEYAVLGREVGDSGTHHIQGYQRFVARKRIGSIRGRIARAHFEVARCPAQAAEYCKKDGEYSEF